jgi:hypothetical protein
MVARKLPQLAGLRLAIRDGHDPLPGRINRQLLDRRLANDRASETLNFRRHQTRHDFGTIPGIMQNLLTESTLNSLHPVVLKTRLGQQLFEDVLDLGLGLGQRWVLLDWSLVPR